MSFRAGQPTFAGGEISDAVAARWDVSKYTTALSRGRNCLGLPQGGQYNRPGLLYAAESYDSEKTTVLLPFIYASGDAYALEFTPGKMRVIYRGALVTRPKLTITAITQAAQAEVTAPAHGYQPGWTVVFEGVEGMVEINGKRAKIVSATTDAFVIDLDTTGFSAFTGDTGGVPGDTGGGSGGEPPPPPPGEDPPPPPLPDNPPPPPYRPPGGGLQPEHVYEL